MISPPLILASQSPRRRELLQRLGVEFDIITKPVDELHDPAIDPGQLCRLNAERKARVIAASHPHATVIGADTLVFLDNSPLGKPKNTAEAANMLASLSGKIHEVITGVSILSPIGNRSFSEITKVEFRELSPADIFRYLNLVHVLDKAGSYALQEHGELIIRRVDGDTDNVIGLPATRLAAELRGLGYEI